MTDQLFSHLLVPTDGSTPSIEAGRLAFRVARAHDSEVTLLHVIDETTLQEVARVAKRSNTEMETDFAVAGRGYLHHLKKVAHEFAVAVQTRTEEGEPHTVIVDVADEIGADLIVMGHAGQRGPRRALIGSVTERVLRFADCPVLVT